MEQLIYFDEHKKAYNYEIPNYIATCPLETWIYYSQPENMDKWDIIDGVFTDITDTPEYIEKKRIEREEKLGTLSLTKADVLRAIYMVKGFDKEDLLSEIQTLDIPDLDVKGLKTEFEANHFYRKNPYISLIGDYLGFTKEQLDLFFETNDYHVLISKTNQSEEV